MAVSSSGLEKFTYGKDPFFITNYLMPMALAISAGAYAPTNGRGKLPVR